MHLNTIYRNLDNIISKYPCLDILNYLIKIKNYLMVFHSKTLCHGELIRMFLKKSIIT